ncbi:hypothetical protein K435DRAFT_788314 [Dendrothele bispora CBS 962.96]|uniref:Uncharacterized protein n=1 Tax=Dendrothele bispora (strain CBS 962.96) TaxID=1314807 RepID=A0A4S8MXZ3_DENBC|nr:hypothetical protein K435DRAFT_788314 [Dendrothele bispora CBS 962.96]
MQYSKEEAGSSNTGPLRTRSLDDNTNGQYSMNVADWDVLFDSERFEEIDDDGNIIPRGEPIDYEPETENTYSPHAIHETLMDEVINTFSSPRFAIGDSMDDMSASFSAKTIAVRNRQFGVPLLRIASSLPHGITNHVLASPTNRRYSDPHINLNPRTNDALCRYQKLFFNALSQAASAKSRHVRKSKEYVSGGSSGKKKKTTLHKESSSRHRGNGPTRSAPAISAAVKTRLRMDLEEYRDSRGAYGRDFSSEIHPGTGSTSTADSGSDIRRQMDDMSMTPTEDDEQANEIKYVNEDMEDDDTAGFVMQVEALSNRTSALILAEFRIFIYMQKRYLLAFLAFLYYLTCTHIPFYARPYRATG